MKKKTTDAQQCCQPEAKEKERADAKPRGRRSCGNTPRSQAKGGPLIGSCGLGRSKEGGPGTPKNCIDKERQAQKQAGNSRRGTAETAREKHKCAYPKQRVSGGDNQPNDCSASPPAAHNDMSITRKRKKQSYPQGHKNMHSKGGQSSAGHCKESAGKRGPQTHQRYSQRAR